MVPLYLNFPYEFCILIFCSKFDFQLCVLILNFVVAFDKERPSWCCRNREFWTIYSWTRICCPQKIFRGKIIDGKWRNFYRPCALFLGVEYHVLPRIVVCFLVEFDLLFAFGVLSCWILDSASLFILYVHELDRLGLEMLTVETAVFNCICWFSSSRDRNGQFYPVEYCLESIEEYSQGKVHKSEPEPRNGNVQCKYCLLY